MNPYVEYANRNGVRTGLGDNEELLKEAGAKPLPKKREKPPKEIKPIEVDVSDKELENLSDSMNSGYGGFVNLNPPSYDELVMFGTPGPNHLLSKIYIPIEFPMNQEKTNTFTQVDKLAAYYANLMGIVLEMTLVGYSDHQNFKFESREFYWYDNKRKIIITAIDGLLNVVMVE